MRASRAGVAIPCRRNSSASRRRAPATDSTEDDVILRVLSGQQLRLMLRHQRVDDLSQRLAIDHLGQLVERQIDPMVAHSPLRKIIGADAFGTVAGAYLSTPFRGPLGIAPL